MEFKNITDPALQIKLQQVVDKVNTSLPADTDKQFNYLNKLRG